MKKNVAIAVVGRAQAGKDTIANYLIEKHGFVRLAYADELKRICSVAYRIPLGHFYDEDKKNMLLHGVHSKVDLHLCKNVVVDLYGDSIPVMYGNRDIDIDHWAGVIFNFLNQLIRPELHKDGVTPRSIAQKIGTEGFRNQVSKSTWTHYVHKQVLGFFNQGKSVVISDLRFENEETEFLSEVKALATGDIWGVRREKAHIFDHQSENEVDGIIARTEVVFDNNGTIDELYSSVKKHLE